MKVGEVWKFNPKKPIPIEDHYSYSGRVRIAKLYTDRNNGESVHVTCEDGSSARAVDSMPDYTVLHFLSVYTKVYK